MTGIQHPHLDLDAAEMDGFFVSEGEPRRARLLVPDDVVPDVLVRDDLDPEIHHGAVAADVIGVVMAVEQVADRLGRHALHPRHHVRDVLDELIVHDDGALGCDAHGDVARLMQQAIVRIAPIAAAGCARIERPADHEQSRFHLVHAHRRRNKARRRHLGAAGGRERQGQYDRNCERCTHGILRPEAGRGQPSSTSRSRRSRR
jgi:hypothetical protein